MKENNCIEILHFTDIHGAGFLFKEINEEINKADLIIISGDITHFGHQSDAKKIINTIMKYNPNILAVAGNCDYPAVETYLQEAHIGIHRKVIEFDRYTIAGVSGSLPCPGTTPYEYTEDEVASWLNTLSEQVTDKKSLIFVPHQPPSDTINDEVNKDTHVGSPAIRKFIRDTSPLLCLTGHIHEGIGVDKINNCPVINPGPFRTGKYAHIKIEGEILSEVNLKQITAN